MKVLLLANTAGLADEGARNVSRAIAAGLEQRHELLCMPASAAVLRMDEIRRFNPHIVHTLHGPSPRTFAMLAVLHGIIPKAALLASLSQTGPTFTSVRTLLAGLRFIHLLTQDPVSEGFFSHLGFMVHPLPNGVEIQRFRPVQPRLPEALGTRFRRDRPTLLHIGHLKSNRGLNLLAELTGYHGWQALVLGSPALAAVPSIVQMLQAAGCVVSRDFVDDLPGLYCAFDAYIFPVSDWTGAIDMPLSVLEAMACNRPVLSTRFKALPRFLSQGEGLYYFDSVEEAKEILDDIVVRRDVATRDKVVPFSWDNILAQLEQIYTACVRA